MFPLDGMEEKVSLAGVSEKINKRWFVLAGKFISIATTFSLETGSP